MSRDLLVISNQADFINKVNKYEYKIDTLNKVDDIDIEKEHKYKASIIDGREFSFSELAGSCQVITQVVSNSKIILVVSNKISNNEIHFLYQSGVDLILSENDYFNSKKVEFFLSHYLHNLYYPIKSYDLDANTSPDFPIYHFIAFKGNFIPVINGHISPEKLEKIKSVNELYIKRSDVDKFALYLKNSSNQGSNKIFSRCRANYLVFLENFVNLLFKVTDESKHYSFEEGKALLAETRKAANELLMTLSAAPNPWLIVNNFSHDNQNSLSRIPAVAAYVGILALELEFEKPEEIMLATLLSDVGLLCLGEKYDLEDYKLHPLKSINLVLERKLPLDEHIKKIILFSHENCLKTGFPKGKDVNADKIPPESQLIQICQMLDEKSLIKKGELRPNLEEVKQVLLEDLSNSRLFDLSLIAKLKNYWQLKSA